MDERLATYNWGKAFECCGPDTSDGEYGRDNEPDIRIAHPQDKFTKRDEFTREDVVEVIALHQESSGQSPDYIDTDTEWSGKLVGKLKDGRYFYLEAGCDYTGWDCQSGGCVNVSDDMADLIRFGMTKRDRDKLGLEMEAEVDE